MRVGRVSASCASRLRKVANDVHSTVIGLEYFYIHGFESCVVKFFDHGLADGLL